jgi:hypothetical protein
MRIPTLTPTAPVAPTGLAHGERPRRVVSGELPMVDAR